MNKSETEPKQATQFKLHPITEEYADFTPEEYRAYREEQGLGWPPEARGDRLLMLIREVGALHGMSEEEAQRLFLDNLLRHGLPDK